MRALIVDDHPAMYFGLTHELQSLGVDTVLTASNATQALQIATDANPPIDLAIVDLRIPEQPGDTTYMHDSGLYGLKLAQTLHDHARHHKRKLRFMLISSYDNYRERLTQLFHSIGHFGIGFYCKASGLERFTTLTRAVMRDDPDQSQRIDSSLNEFYNPSIRELGVFFPPDGQRVIDTATTKADRIGSLDGDDEDMIRALSNGISQKRYSVRSGISESTVEQRVRELKKTFFDSKSDFKPQYGAFSLFVQLIHAISQHRRQVAKPDSIPSRENPSAL